MHSAAVWFSAMKSYGISCGYEDVTADKDLPQTYGVE